MNNSWKLIIGLLAFMVTPRLFAKVLGEVSVCETASSAFSLGFSYRGADLESLSCTSCQDRPLAHPIPLTCGKKAISYCEYETSCTTPFNYKIYTSMGWMPGPSHAQYKMQCTPKKDGTCQTLEECFSGGGLSDADKAIYDASQGIRPYSPNEAGQ